MEILAIIPARGGSKSIPKKNLYPLLGKPMIAYAIESARAAKHITRTIVSTDSEEIASVARQYGAETPFMRPEELAGDRTPDLPVFQHALTWLKEHEGYVPDIVMHVWATSPYRKTGDLDRIIELLMSDQNATAALSVTTPGQSPYKMFEGEQKETPYLVPLFKASRPDLYEKGKVPPHESPRQSLPKAVQLTGYMAAIRPSTILEKNSMMGERILPFYHDPDTYTEADSYKDLAHAELVLKEMAEKETK